MTTNDFDFELDESLIAQTPPLKRSDSRLMIVNKNKKDIYHHNFNDIYDYLKKGDVLVLNNTKVIPARLYGIKKDTNAHVEILILKIGNNNIIECLVGNAKKVKEGTEIVIGDGLIRAVCLEIKEEGIRVFKFIYDGILLEVLEKIGTMPLPPYIKEKLLDNNRYQTVYAKYNGSAAAPTAGLHFTEELIDRLKEKGIIFAEVTLHVGLGTFKPVSIDDFSKHKMHEEEYEMSNETATVLNLAKKENRRIIAVGTTSLRTLETIYSQHNEFKEQSGVTSIFIYPGYEIKSIDGLVTNFHLPKSTLIMLVSALAGIETIKNAYSIAIKEKYRFFSFGDSMFITNLDN